MNKQVERQNYIWRENDNNSTTLTKFALELEHPKQPFKVENNKPNKTSKPKINRQFKR